MFNMFNNENREMLEEVLNQEAITACRENNLSSLSILLLEKNKNVCHFANYNEYFQILCEVGNLTMVKWMVENCGRNINFESDNYNFLKDCAKYGNLEVLDYLITSKAVAALADLSCYRNNAFQNACTNCQIEVIDYFLHKIIMDNKNNPNAKNELQTDLESGLYYSSLVTDYKALEHIIINWDIQLEEGPREFVERLPYDATEGKEMLVNLYEKRDLYKKINEKIVNKEISSSVKKKI